MSDPVATRTDADLRDAQDALTEFSMLAVAWLQAQHGTLLLP